MKRETLLTTAVIALLLLNFGTLGFLFFRKPPHPPGVNNRALDRQIVETLALNPTQKQQFDSFKKNHHEQMISFNQQYRKAMENYFALLKNETIEPVQQDSMLAILSNIQQEKALVTFEHFKTLKTLCTPEQQQNFEALLPELLQVILPPRPQGPPPQH